MVAEIIKLQPENVGAAYPPLNPDDVLKTALGAFADVVIIGIDNDGEIRIQMSHGTEEHALFLLEKAKQKLLGAW